MTKIPKNITWLAARPHKALIREYPPGVLGLRFWVFVLETLQTAHCWWKRTSWWSSHTWFVFTSSLIILSSRRRSFWTTRIWTSQFLSNNLPDDWIHRRKEIQNGCLEITLVTVERGRSGNYTENKTGLYIDRVKIKLECVKKIKLDCIKIKLDCINIKTGLCKTITGLSKTNTGLWLSWAIVALRTIRVAWFATSR